MQVLCVTATLSSYYGFGRLVYEELLKKGEIVRKPEVTPPTVPMDYNWARVSVCVCMWFCCHCCSNELVNSVVATGVQLVSSFHFGD